MDLGGNLSISWFRSPGDEGVTSHGVYALDRAAPDRCDPHGMAAYPEGQGRILAEQGGKDLGIPVAPQLLEAIVVVPTESKGHLCFVTTAHGKPF